MKIAHATDIHWFVPPTWCEILRAPKRTIGALNLYARQRQHEFQPVVQAALVDAILAQTPDVVLISGDLTATATPDEFQAAATALAPILTQVPTLVQSGNHDVYTRGAAREGRLAATFGEAMFTGVDGLASMSVPGVTIVGLDPSRPHLTASGVVPDEQLKALPSALAAAPADDALILSLHYPIVDGGGVLYDHWEHGLRNAGALVDVLAGCDRKPTFVTPGHIHHGYRSTIHAGDVEIPTFNPGSGGYALDDARDRAACFNVYETDGPKLVGVTRMRYSAAGFAPEAGGAYATGR